MAAPESVFKTWLRKAFERLFGEKTPDAVTFALTPSAGQPSGLPDRFFGALGSSAWVEGKTHSYRISAIQEWMFSRMARCGNRIIVVTELLDARVGLELYDDQGAIQPLRTFDRTAVHQRSFWASLLGVSS